MKKLSIILSCLVLFGLSLSIYLFEQNKGLRHEIKLLKEQSISASELHKKENDWNINAWQERNNDVSALVESVLRLQKQYDSISKITVGYGRVMTSQ